MHVWGRRRGGQGGGSGGRGGRGARCRDGIQVIVLISVRGGCFALGRPIKRSRGHNGRQIIVLGTLAVTRLLVCVLVPLLVCVLVPLLVCTRVRVFVCTPYPRHWLSITTRHCPAECMMHLQLL